MLFIWNLGPDFSVTFLVAWVAVAVSASVFDHSDKMQNVDLLKSSTVPQSINSKPKNFYNETDGTTTFLCNFLLSADVFPIIFVLNSKDLHVFSLLLFTLKLSSLFSLVSSFTSSL